MTASEREWREISQNQFGPDAFINQGNFHVHLPLPSAPAKAVRRIPYLPNEDLVCRKEVVDQLDKLLPPTPGFYNAALWGLGGSGKTQIALDYAYRRCVDAECVLWVHADSEATFTSDYKAIGKKLGVNDASLDGPELLDAVRDRIEAQPRWVLIVDNADDLGLFGVGRTGESLAKYIPGGLQGTILWTSRDGRIAGTLVGSSRGIEVPSMTKDEATSLLELSMSEAIKPGGIEETETNQLLEELQRLPLAISQAGIYMRRTRTPIKKHLKDLLQGMIRWDLLNMTNSDRHRRPEVSNSVLATWEISIKRIQEESELSYRILQVIAYLDSLEIPHQLMLAAGQGSASSEEDENTYRRRDLEVLQAVTRLVEFSFLHTRGTEEGQRSYEMHKLVQEAIRYRLRVKRPDKSPLGEYTALGDSPENTEQYFSSVALQIVTSAFENASWLQRNHYIPHAIQVGEWAEVSGKEADASALLNGVSKYMHGYGRWRERESVDRKVISLRTKALGGKHPDTIKGMIFLVDTHLHLGRYSEAEKLAEQVLEICRQSLREKHPITMIAMSILARIYRYQARDDEAERLSKQVLGLQLEELGENHPQTARSIFDLAIALVDQERYDEAEKLKKKALALYKALLGDSHPETLKTMGNLAKIYNLQGRYAESEKLNKQALSLQLRDLGDKHLDTLETMRWLATTYDSLGRYNDSEKMMKKVLNHGLEIYGEAHPYTLQCMRSVATIYHKNGRYADSEKLNDQILEHQLEILGKKHLGTIRTMIILAMTYNLQGQYTKAERLIEQVLRLIQEVSDSGHPETALIMGKLAEMYAIQGRHNESKRLKEQVLRLRLKVLGEKKHPHTMRVMGALSINHHDQRRLGEAAMAQEQTLRFMQEILGPKHPETIRIMTELGATYLSQRRWLDGQRMLVDARVLQVEIFGEKHSDTIETRAYHGVLLYNGGRYNEAKWMFITALDLQREVLGDRHPSTLLSMARLAQCWRHTDPGEAKKILVELLQIHRKMNGDEHSDTIQTMEDLAACEEEIRSKNLKQAIQSIKDLYRPRRRFEVKIWNRRFRLRRILYRPRRYFGTKIRNSQFNRSIMSRC